MELVKTNPEYRIKIHEELRTRYEDDEDWRGYVLYACGHSLRETIQNAEISVINQHGVEVNSCLLKDAPFEVQIEAQLLIDQRFLKSFGKDRK